MNWKQFNKIQKKGIKITLSKLDKYMNEDNGLTHEEKVQEVLTKGHKIFN